MILVLAACGSDGVMTEAPPPEPTTGTIEVSAATTGEDPDPDGYATRTAQNRYN